MERSEIGILILIRAEVLDWELTSCSSVVRLLTHRGIADRRAISCWKLLPPSRRVMHVHPLKNWDRHHRARVHHLLPGTAHVLHLLLHLHLLLLLLLLYGGYEAHLLWLHLLPLTHRPLPLRHKVQVVAIQVE